MKTFGLTLSLVLYSILSFAGGCGVQIHKVFTTNETGRMAQLSFTVSGNGTANCDNCMTGVWFKQEGTRFVTISSNGTFLNIYESGIYRVEVCGVYGMIKIEEGEVYRTVVLPDEMIHKFSVYPNPTREGRVNLLVPDSPVSTQTDTYKVEIYNVLGTKVFNKEKLQFGTRSLPIDLSNQGKGIFIVRITSGEEVKILKVLVN